MTAAATKRENVVDFEYRGRVETITPEMAEKWLEKVVSNRNVIQTRVDSIAADIRADRWILTGDPIRFDLTGEMIDGQHRLWAIVEAGIPIRTYVVRGLPPEAKLVIDTGAKRTLANYFQITREKNAPLLAGILTIVYLYDLHRYQGAGRGPTHAEAETMLANHPEFRDSVEVAREARAGIGLAPSPMGAAHAINARHDSEAADEFWTRVADGAGLEVGSPILAFRRYAVKILSSRLDRPTTRTQFAHAMKAMKLWRDGKKARVITWNVGSDSMPPDWGPQK